ncbi:hypothetical protein [Noviherbaspirillum malthae]|uniref:hypothetical protein n=1 Tax=Noviherbaspirillum malthae TaxID=1260987 RepID=UPI00188E1FEF|nr:hypothetical protein [Noviherbaspirillum malthae]
MTSKLTKAYENAKVGDTFWIRSDAQSVESLSTFQAVVHAANVMRNDGLIHVVRSHQESTTGKRFIDALQLTKLK